MMTIVIPVLVPQQQLSVYFWGQANPKVIPENWPVKQKPNV